MPTTLPSDFCRTKQAPGKRRRHFDWWIAFLVVFGLACAVIELADPAPMDVEAALFVAP
jgi:hypothetical protein